MEVDQLRSLAIDAANKSSFQTAIFFANKLVSLNPESLDDIYLLAQCYYKSNEFKRANHLLEKYLASNKETILDDARPTTTVGPRCDENSDIYKKCILLVGICRGKYLDWHGCLQIIGEEDSTTNLHLKPTASSFSDLPPRNELNTDSAICLLRANAFEALDLRPRAIHWYKEALKRDVYCVEAWEKLTQHAMIAAPEEEQLLKSLLFPKHANWLKSFYYAKSNFAYTTRSNQVLKNIESLDQIQGMTQNEDVLLFNACARYYASQFSQALKITSIILGSDPYCFNAMILHISCLMEIGMTNDLYLFAHKLVDEFPKSHLTWYAVGCYYYMINSWPTARRYFNKSNSLYNEFGAGWLAYGHTFAREGEHDQAMASYRTAARLLAGSYLPYIAIASEFIRSNNPDLAREFVQKASEMNPMDPSPVHEAAVIYYLKKEWTQAIALFEKALAMMSQEMQSTECCEPLLFNLGHACRKDKQYERAIHYYERALWLMRYNPSIYIALAYTYHLKGELSKAIDYYHQGHGLSQDDSAFSATMLQQALEEIYIDGKDFSPIISGT